MKANILPYLLAVVLLVLGIAWAMQSPATRPVPVANAAPLTVYKSPTCGCCEQYIAYLKREGYDVTVENRNDMDAVKQQYGVPRELQSCHTTVAGDRVIEGHVPVEAVRAYMETQSDGSGIALPGMPIGSPGMPGFKQGPFEIRRFGNGATDTFMSL